MFVVHPTDHPLPARVSSQLACLPLHGPIASIGLIQQSRRQGQKSPQMRTRQESIRMFAAKQPTIVVQPTLQRSVWPCRWRRSLLSHCNLGLAAQPLTRNASVKSSLSPRRAFAKLLLLCLALIPVAGWGHTYSSQDIARQYITRLCATNLKPSRGIDVCLIVSIYTTSRHEPRGSFLETPASIEMSHGLGRSSLLCCIR